MVFTVVLGIIVAPDVIQDTFAARVTGLARYLSPRAQTFWLSMGFYTGAMAIQSQAYCLIYRFTIIFDKRWHQIYMTWWMTLGFIVLQQVIAIILATMSYLSCIPPEVCC